VVVLQYSHTLILAVFGSGSDFGGELDSHLHFFFFAATPLVRFVNCRKLQEILELWANASDDCG